MLQPGIGLATLSPLISRRLLARAPLNVSVGVNDGVFRIGLSRDCNGVTRTADPLTLGQRSLFTRHVAAEAPRHGKTCHGYY